MLSALLLIVKIIGIILLVILAVLLVLIGLVLFVPFRYQISGYRKEGEDVPVHVRLRVSWLLRIVRVLYAWPDAAYVKVRLLFFTIFSTAKKEEPSHDDRPPKRPKKKTKDKKRKGGEADEKNTIFAALDKPEEETEAPLLIDETVETPSDEGNGAVEGDGPSTENKTWATPFIKIINKIKAMIKAVRDKIVGLFNKIRYTTKEIYAKIKDVVENISYYVEIIKSDRFKKAIKLCWRQLGAIVRSIRPTKLKAQLVFGTGDPASTGQILEFYSILYPFIGNNVVITPDFEAKIMEGEFLIKGRVTVIVLLRAAWTIYRDKNIRKLIKLLKREVS